MFIRTICVLSCIAGVAFSHPDARGFFPIVQLDQGVFFGTPTAVTNEWRGIPFAQPPVGDLRFRLPQPVGNYTGTYSATSYGPACPQQGIDLPDLPPEVNTAMETVYQVVTPYDEDCLSLNVVVPSWTPANAKLPVVVWMYGGGFETGAANTYPGTTLVARSISINHPIIYVSLNYRVSAYGFLASQEVKDAGVGNLGLQDQRLALRWVQKYISAFGGDPTKVTIWGESAGAISVALHMLMNGGDPGGLFRGAFMQSGSPIPVGDILHGQSYYDDLVSRTGCSNSTDTLQCLRKLPFVDLETAVNQSPSIFSYQSLKLAWLPRADGVLLPDDFQKLVLQGSVANVPFVTGDCDDEGTIFSLTNLNITTDDEFADYIISNYLPGANANDPTVAELFEMYPSDPAQGSPFDTGDLNAITPEFKRLAAFQGDLVFQGPRRFFLQNRADKQKTWAFLSKKLKAVVPVGSAHGTDVPESFGAGKLADFLINFVTYLDPNGMDAEQTWPQYTVESPQLMTFYDFPPFMDLTLDNYRVDAINMLTNVSLAHPF